MHAILYPFRDIPGEVIKAKGIGVPALVLAHRRCAEF
jgi:hypothetical protein